MIDTLNNINKRIQNASIYISVVLLFLIIISTSVQVFTRYVMNASLIGTEEIGRYSFIWATMLGSAICVSNFSHATVSFIPDMLKGKAKLANICIVQGLIMLLAFVFIVQGGKMILITLNQLSPTLKIPMWLIYSAVPVGGVMILFVALCNMLNIISGKEIGGI